MPNESMISDATAQVTDKVSEFGRKAADKIDQKREAAASGLERAGGIAHSAGDKLDATGEYLRESDVNKMMKDVEGIVRNNPGPALLAAAAVGFLVARAFSRND
jgi:ElaB/YqjD/DUF883 family membrane-anchored ribosome-binding protein